MKKEEGTRGVALVELAIILPIALLLVLGTVNLGVWLVAHYRGAGVLYEGLRYASVFSGLETGTSGVRHSAVQEYVGELIDAYSLDSTAISTSYTGPENEGGDNSISMVIALTVDLPFPFPASTVSTSVRGTTAYLSNQVFLQESGSDLFVPTSNPNPNLDQYGNLIEPDVPPITTEDPDAYFDSGNDFSDSAPKTAPKTPTTTAPERPSSKVPSEISKIGG